MAQTTSAGSTFGSTDGLVCGICGSGSNADGGTLLRCGRCKLAYYCTKECQAKDWPCHKLASPLPGTKGWKYVGVPKELHANGFPAVLVAMTVKAQGCMYEMTGSFMKNGNPASTKFTDAPITTALGFPLRYAWFPKTGLPLPNTTLKLLTLDPNPQSQTFGQPSMPTSPLGGIVVLRGDGKYVQTAQIMALINYLTFKLAELRAVKEREAAGEIVDRQDIANRLLTPAAFAAAFERERQEAAAEGRAGWVGAKNPTTGQGQTATAAT
ncbi:hypothetical protein LTR56_013103 [Elasticomyces elasticus]|nr:hypothetical protein LTR56_013103 [Elasticomyces elasticus]KAK3640282.1 hypothetical protein LTR22_017117 [Elasticomyces elasticus]KAK4920559.1 hypothetical protein LTR49_011974 [Elasticomyces elasticus]KAK5758941.1 hypothetical protein LTS12_010882 [Elasticomyces elasticus]